MMKNGNKQHLPNGQNGIEIGITFGNGSFIQLSNDGNCTEVHDHFESFYGHQTAYGTQHDNANHMSLTALVDIFFI